MADKARLGVVLIAGVCVSFVVGMVFGSLKESAKENLASPQDKTNTLIFNYRLASDSLYERANATAKNIARTGSRSGIVAHHLLVADKIAQLFASLGTGQETTVVILSPNHFSRGQSSMQTAIGSWATPYGNVEADEKSIMALLEAVPELRIEPETFKMEHGISAIVPFVKYWFPQTQLVPLVIHDSANYEQITQLAQLIEKELTDAIVIASVDMSHYLPEHIQQFHDEVSMRTIAAGGCDGECQLEVDANAVLETLFELNRLRGTQSWVQTYHGSSLAMEATKNWEENTSHILGMFEAGQPRTDPFLSLHFVGDIMLDRGVRTWIEEKGVDYPWGKMTRYLQGSDLRIGNLEGTISETPSLFTHDPPFVFTFAPEFVQALVPFIDVVSLANNHAEDYGFSGEEETHEWLAQLDVPWFGSSSSSTSVYQLDNKDMQISMIGFHQFGASIDELVSVIKQESDEGRFVIVMPHWGEEYITQPQNGQRSLAKQMIEAGAKLIVGGHPHVAQGIEIIDNVPVIYSLGNFIFDQEFGETTRGMTLGVILEKKSATLYLSSISTLDAQPTPLSDEEANKLFSERNIPSSIITIFYDESSS